MSLVTDIETIVKDISPNCTFCLSSEFKANVLAHRLKKEHLPYIILDNELNKNVEIKKNANFIATTRIRIRFLDQDRPKKTDVEREEIRQSMEDIANRVMVRIFQLEEVRPAGNQTYTLVPVFHYYAKDMTGVMAEMQTNINLQINWC